MAIVCLGLAVIAEGVDTEYQVAMLRAANVHAAQGFYFSRPLDTASLFAFQQQACGSLPCLFGGLITFCVLTFCVFQV